ncbi:MAG: hypothetical protein ACREWG_04375 [Gammaproteobacteria bacterium]
MNVFEHEAMTGSKFPVEGLFEDFVFSSQGAFGQIRQLLDRDPVNQAGTV